MVYSTRKAMLKQIEAAQGNMETAMAHLWKMRETYKERLPEVTRQIDCLAEAVAGLQQAMRDIERIL